MRELGAFVEPSARDHRQAGGGEDSSLGDPAFLDDWFADCVANPAHCPDYIQIDGGEGGTGAAPAPLADYVGLPITQALPHVAAAGATSTACAGRIRIIASGKLVTPDKVAWAMCMGADFVSSARGFMFSLGCIQAMKCGIRPLPDRRDSGRPAADRRAWTRPTNRCAWPTMPSGCATRWRSSRMPAG